MHIFAIANQKGGVGKTTTSVNLAAALALRGQRTLLVDLDPQGNATMGSGVDKQVLGTSVYQLLLGLAELAETLVVSPGAGYHLLPANRDLAGAEVEMVQLERREVRLKEALASHAGDYDFVLIDCPPSLSLLTLNGLCAAHGVVIPMQCEYFALEGLSDLVNTIKKVHANLNRDLKIIGLLRVMFDPRSTLSNQASTICPAPPAKARCARSAGSFPCSRSRRRASRSARTRGRRWEWTTASRTSRASASRFPGRGCDGRRDRRGRRSSRR